jgi:hypothetical protein
MKLMDRKGDASIPFAFGGVVDLGVIDPKKIGFTLDAAEFADKRQADRIAKSKGWGVVDGNHRCPACLTVPQPDPPRRGAYIEIPDCAANPVPRKAQNIEEYTGI